VEICDQDGMVLLPDLAVDSADPDLEEGTMVGEYRIDALLGKGGFGTVYRAVHPLIGKKAAVKVLSRACSTNPEMVSRFIAEARSVNTIEHDNIIDIFAFGTLESDGRHYFVMELLDGLGLGRYLTDRGPLSPTLLIYIMSGVTQALAAAHSKSIIHRDLKPDNVFLAIDSGGMLKTKLLDFGMAKLLGKTTVGHQTQSGVPVGTPQYMSPEQCSGLQADHRADIYSFGVMCFEALAGKPPFEGSTLLSLMRQHTSAKRPALSSVYPELGDCFDGALRAMMAIDPNNRPQSITAAFELLKSAAARAGVDPDSEVKFDRSLVSLAAAPSVQMWADDGATPDEISQADTIIFNAAERPASGIHAASQREADRVSAEPTPRTISRPAGHSSPAGPTSRAADSVPPGPTSRTISSPAEHSSPAGPTSRAADSVPPGPTPRTISSPAGHSSPAGPTSRPIDSVPPRPTSRPATSVLPGPVSSAPRSRSGSNPSLPPLRPAESAPPGPQSRTSVSPEPTSSRLPRRRRRERKKPVVSWKAHRGARYLLIDCSHLKAQAYLQALDEATVFAGSISETCLLILIDVRQTTVTRQVVKRLRQFAPAIAPHAHACAIVGITEAMRVTLSAINILARKGAGAAGLKTDIEPFDEPTAALDWLVQQR